MEKKDSPSTNVHYAKGKRHGRKRYYNGKRKQSTKQQEDLDLSAAKGERIIFKDNVRILLGWVGDKVQNGQFMIVSRNPALKTENATCPFMVTNANDPLPLCEFPANELLERGAHVLFVWDSDHFIELRPAVFLCKDRDHIWVKPTGVHAVRTVISEIFQCPNSIDIDDAAEERRADINVISMIIDSYENSLRETQLLFQTTQEKITKCEKGQGVLKHKFESLLVMYKRALITINELRKALFQSCDKSYSKSARILTLLETISQINGQLKQQRSKLIDSSRQIYLLTNKIEKTTKENENLIQKLDTISMEKEEWERLAKSFEKEMNDAQMENKNLQRENDCLVTKQSVQLEQRSTSSAGHNVTLARPAGSKIKPHTLVKLILPQESGAEASPKVLNNRAKELMKVLELLSSRNQPTEDDLRATLVSFIRKYPTLAAAAYDEAELSVYKELSPGETLDLKLLLRLPMRKFRLLRTFLQNCRVDILASDKKIYRELAGRRDVTSDVIEIGEMLMQKLISSAEPSKVAFVRVRGLQLHIETLLAKKQERGDLWDHENFRNEIWIKIMGDKGGTSTKLAFQICNFQDGNSADNTDLLAMFSATDSYSNMAKVFSIFREDIVGLQEKSQVRVGRDSKICRIFLSGDYEFLTKILGHMGPNASYPCLWCYVPLQALSAGGPTHAQKLRQDDGQYVDNPNWYSKRQPDELIQDLADNKADPRRGGDTKANGPYHHSLAVDPILPIIHDMSHVVPPILHIMLGLVVRFYRSLEDLCRKKDQSTLGERDEGLNDRWEEMSVEVNECEREYSIACEEQKYQERLLVGFKKVQEGKRGKGASDPCALPACALSVISCKEGDVQWVQCDVCGIDDESGWFHTDCVGLKGVNVNSVRFECQVCKGEVATVGDVVRKQVLVVERHTEMFTELKKRKDSGKRKLDAIFLEVKSHMGPLEKELGRILEDDLGVKKQAYHSQCFVGNHCQVILKNSEKLLAVLEGFPQQEKLQELFTRLQEIFSFSRSCFLTDKEVAVFSSKCWDLGEWFPRVFPEERIPPKLHMLICHVPECAAAWNTVGMLGEHGIESIHAQVNADERIYGNVRDHKERMKLIFTHHGQRLLSDRKHLNTSKRKCVKDGCDGRYKLVNNVKTCPKCLTCE